MSLKYKHSRKTLAEWTASNPVIVDNEIVIVSDLNKIKSGDGIHTFNELPFINNETINVKEFGVVGNGITDNSEKLLVLLSYMNDGGTIFFPKGEYLINTNFEINKNVVIEGEIGSVIKLQDYFLRIRNNNVQFNNIEFNLNQQSIIVSCYNNEITITDNRYYSSIYQNVIFTNCKFTNSVFKHIQINFSKYIHFINCEFYLTGVTPTNVDDFYIDNCKFDANYENSLEDEILPIGVYVYGRMTNSTLKNSVPDTIDLYQCKKFIIDNCTFDGCLNGFIELKAVYRSVNDPYYFTATNCTGIPELIVISNNIFKGVKNPLNTHTPKFFISGGFEDNTSGEIDLTSYYRDSIIIENNLFDDTFLDSVNEVPTYVCAIMLHGLNGAKILNNLFKPKITGIFFKSYSTLITKNIIITGNTIAAYDNINSSVICNLANSSDISIISNNILQKGILLNVSSLGANSGCLNINLEKNVINVADSNGIIQLISGTTNKLNIYNSDIKGILIYSTNDEINIFNSIISKVINVRSNITATGITSLLSFNNCIFAINGLNVNLYGDGIKTISKLILIGCTFNSGAYILNNATITEYYQNGNIATSTPGYVFSGTKPTAINNESYF